VFDACCRRKIGRRGNRRDLRQSVANPKFFQGAFTMHAADFRSFVWAAVCLATLLTGNCQAEDASRKVGGKNLADVDRSNQDAQFVVQGNNQFAFDLYAQLRTEPGNLFFSPYSISSALSMTYAGARGETAKEMAEVLHFNSVGAKVHAAQGALIKALNSQDAKRPYQLAVANRLWGQQSYPFLNGFQQLLDQNYGAKMELIDFGRSEIARQTINNWAEQKTLGKIKDLIPPAAINSDTRLVLVNAIYFKGNWAEQFKSQQTFPQPFFLSAGKDVSVPMMHHTSEYLFAHVKYDGEKQLKVLLIPYQSNELSMVVLLPDAQGGLADLENHLSAGAVKDWMGKLKHNEVQLTLPKFQMTAGFRLEKTLANMGMPLAFSPPSPHAEGADFSGVNGGKELYLSAVIHKAFVDVNEEGTEAAAATAVVPPPPGPVGMEPAQFLADHPFVFLIRDNRSESILFVGRVSNPEGANGVGAK
jgi:serpin B